MDWIGSGGDKRFKNMSETQENMSQEKRGPAGKHFGSFPARYS